MSVATLSQQDIKALEQTRQRLSQLVHSLSSLQQQILQSDPLPPWASLQSVAAIVSQNLASMSQQLNTNYDLFSAMPVYPLPLYPAQTQEPLLEQLLRKKLEPKVEDWAAEGRKIAIEATEEGSNCYSQSEMNDLWSWAGMAANEEARKHTWGGNYTLEEEEIGVENVVTGLLRKLKADPDDSSEEEDDEEEAVQAVPDPDEMEVVGVHRKEGGDGVEFDIRWQSQYRPTEPNLNALPINDTFRFLMTGSMPSKS